MKYVVELARAIASHPAVHRVELLTRLVQDPKVSISAPCLWAMWHLLRRAAKP